MRGSKRDVLLVLLAVASGSADAWSYLGLGHAFVANMTGNTVLLGIGIFLHRDLLHPGISLICYLAGAALASFLTRNVGEGTGWPGAVTSALTIESMFLLVAAVGWWFAGRKAALAGSTWDLDLLLGCVALAIGIQSGAMLQLKIPGIVTTYITGTWTTLTSNLTGLFTRERHAPRGEKIAYEERMNMQALIVCAYLLSAIASGLLFRYSRLAVGALPAISVLSVAAYGLGQKSGANV
jgi:uncharacterized membrane protein YoaK (UPF0700 family)